VGSIKISIPFLDRPRCEHVCGGRQARHLKQKIATTKTAAADF